MFPEIYFYIVGLKIRLFDSVILCIKISFAEKQFF
jgi:hypothetical protein